MRVTLLGAQGFVGSAFRRFLETRPDIELVPVTRDNYVQARGQVSDVVIDASGNSKKFLADQDLLGEFELSVVHRLRTLVDFPARCHLHISSVDVYHDLAHRSATSELVSIDRTRQSNYGFHKLLAEDLVRRQAAEWLIVRLGGMVGPGLRKNPVYDLLHRKPLRVHPDSQYQFMHTDQVAQIGWMLMEKGVRGIEVNVCADGLISPRTIAGMLGRSLDLSLLPADAGPRVVDVSVNRLGEYTKVPLTTDVINAFLRSAA